MVKCSRVKLSQKCLLSPHPRALFGLLVHPFTKMYPIMHGILCVLLPYTALNMMCSARKWMCTAWNWACPAWNRICTAWHMMHMIAWNLLFAAWNMMCTARSRVCTALNIMYIASNRVCTDGI